MKIIGTAGHVDHGKTALIRAMTGIDADRLPEEKARGMTTDLGFAWYEGEDGLPVGVVDVPGHERYLRNMVAGAWGLDLALLVIAADDGWMPQTGLHAAIVAASGVPAVIVALNKAELAGPERLAELEARIELETQRLYGAPCPIVRVSALRGQGIDELKAAIACRLGQSARRDAAGAYLFVDRSFTPKAGGAVVTGSLRGGALKAGQNLRLWPADEGLAVKAVEGYGRRVGQALPASRAALALPGRKAGYGRGMLLADPKLPIACGDELIAKLLPLPGESRLCPVDQKGRPAIRAGVEAELALGSAKADATLWPIKDSPFVRLKLSEPLACPAGFAMVLLRKGGAELIGRGFMIGAAAELSARAKGGEREPAADVAQRLAAAEAAAEALRAAAWDEAPGPALASLAPIYARGWERLAALAPDCRAALAAACPAGLALCGQAVFTRRRYDELKAALLDGAAKPGGLSRAAATSLSGLEGVPLDGILDRLCAEGALSRQGAAWIVPGAKPEPPAALKALAARLKAAGKEGLEPGKSCPQAEAAGLKALCSYGLAMPLDGGIFLDAGVYDALVRAALAGMIVGQGLSVPEAKERTGLSRKYILPLLNKMEGAGWVKRRGDERTVLKLPG